MTAPDTPSRTPTRRRALTLLAGAAATTAAAWAHGETEPAADQLAESGAAVDRLPSWTGLVAVTDSRGTEAVRRRSGRMATRLEGPAGVPQRLYVFTAPDDIRGTTLLIHEHPDRDDDIWLYLPSLGKTRRMAGGGRKSSFVGTQYAFFDLMSFEPARYRHTVAGSVSWEGRSCWILESTPRDAAYAEDIGRSKLRSWIDKANHQTLRVDHHDASGSAFKRHVLGGFAAAPGGKALATARTMTHLHNGSSTHIAIEQIDFQARLASADFQPARLAP